jgi:hypothetical protein
MSVDSLNINEIVDDVEIVEDCHDLVEKFPTGTPEREKTKSWLLKQLESKNDEVVMVAKIILQKIAAYEKRWKDAVLYMELNNIPSEKELKRFNKTCLDFGIKKDSSDYYKNYILHFSEHDNVINFIYREARIIPIFNL